MGAVSVEAILSGRGAAQVNAADRDGVFLGTATATEQIELVAVSASVCRAGGVAQLVSLFSVHALEHRVQDEPGRRRRGGRLPGPRRRGQGRGAGDRAQGARHRRRARGEPCRAGAVAVVRGRRAGVRRRPGRSRGEARRVLRMRGVLLPVQGTP